MGNRDGVVLLDGALEILGTSLGALDMLGALDGLELGTPLGALDMLGT